MIVFATLLGLVAGALAEDVAPISFKMIDYYEVIWTDAGSGSHNAGSYWAPKALAYDYFALGDFVHNAHSTPTTKSALVKENEPGALKAPIGFTDIWDDAGSGASTGVIVFKMTPPSGYTCLGNAAVDKPNTIPDASKYRCVKTEYVSVGDLIAIWDDSGTNSYRGISSWRVIRGSDVEVQEAGTFISLGQQGKPTETPYLLNSNYAKEALMVTEPEGFDEDIPIKLYKTSDIQKIWSDAGSGAYAGLTCSRAKGEGDTFSLGDIPLGYQGIPMYGIVAKSVEDGALQAPFDYREIWNDKGSGSYQNGAIWEPLCHGGYIPLGSVCSGDYNKPAISEVRCVKQTHVATGKWVNIWTDAGSGAPMSTSVFKAVADDPNEQGMEAMSAVGYNTDSMPEDKLPYVLIGDHTIMLDGKPAKGYYVTNVVYDLDQTQILSQDPSYLATTTIENHGDTEQTTTRTFAAEWSETRDWSSMAGIESSISMTTEAGVPLFVKETVTVGVTATFEYQSGGSVSQSMTDSISATITVQPHCQKTVDMVGVNYVADIPYTADVRTEYEDGTTGFRYGVQGVYYGTNVGDRRVIYGADIPIV